MVSTHWNTHTETEDIKSLHMKPYLQLTTLNIIADTLAKFHQTKYLFHFRKCAENEQNANTQCKSILVSGL